MDNDKLLTISITTVALAIAIGVTMNSLYTKSLMSEMVKSGSDPLEVTCMLKPTSTSFVGMCANIAVLKHFGVKPITNNILIKD